MSKAQFRKLVARVCPKHYRKGMDLEPVRWPKRSYAARRRLSRKEE